jgi:putative addiction module component (TIGR02574 family)
MNNAVDQVLQAALSLPEDDRVHLVDALIASFESADSAPFDDAWLQEIGRRTAEYEAGLVQLVPWDEVKKQAT